jgi:penicillin-binding protein 1C
LKLTQKRKIKLTFIGILIFIYWLILPSTLFKNPVCTVIVDKNGKLLGAHIAVDGQYRFPNTGNVPEKFRKALTTFEDKRFSYHWGIDPVAFGRAFYKNIREHKVVSGGSTITMQVIRLWRGEKKRTILEKIIEMFWAVRLEFSYTKKSILNLYASNAPFGGNVIGLDAASWRWFGRTPEELTWAETATLAVLPNSPALIHFGRNRHKLKVKRDVLLKKMFHRGIIDKETYELSVDEPIPEKPLPFPEYAPHLLARADKENNNFSIIKTTIDLEIQNQVNQIVERNHFYLSGNGINNLAAIVVDVETGNVVAYIGNIGNFKDKKHGNQVDIITSHRSTGSILKPFLYASMLTSGDILPNALVFDIPTQINGYAPKNYNKGYEGAIPARQALARSLNIPAVRMLQDFGVEKFHRKLQQIGLTSLTKPPSHYGLSLILGGCEGSLWDITGIYASMARTLNHYSLYGEKYLKSDFHPPIYLNDNKEKTTSFWSSLDENSYFSASAIWFTFNAMIDVERPEDENYWREFSSSEKIAWKTGTSFGFRDAWAIGVTPKYAVGVWAGNADGEGRAGLVGIRAAAPILFEIFDILPDSPSWFAKPISDMEKIVICRKSGYLASEFCTEKDTVWLQKNADRFSVCPFHKIIHLDKTGKFQVNSNCENTFDMITKSWFILPPSVESYYKNKHADYEFLPPLRDDCAGKSENTMKNMEIVYPYSGIKIYVPFELDGRPGKTIFEAAHRKKDAVIYWYIDNQLVGQTTEIHQMELRPEPGKHVLTLTDDSGEKVSRNFEIIGKQK